MRVSPRGRAILHPISAETASERTYRPGDFVLTRSKGALARAMGLATASRLNQAALIVDSSGGLIEVNPFFVTTWGGLRRSHINEYLERGAPVLVGYVELLDGTRDEVVRFAEQMLREQRRFSEWQFAGLLLHLGIGVAPRNLTGTFRALRPLHALFDHHALVLKEENIFTSAELVARALERGGFLWGKDPAYMTPADLLERFCPPGRNQELQRAITPGAISARVRAPVRSGGPQRMMRVGTAGAGAAPLGEAPESEAAITAPASSGGSRILHPQEQMAWGVGAILLGGLVVTLGLGWAARALKMTRYK
ncbi:MAG TPA: hypothetical protein VH599_12860 [Ktedonobacterales bacterium]|jgi:hypothetical protein